MMSELHEMVWQGWGVGKAQESAGYKAGPELGQTSGIIR